uniref:SRP9 domain-containing protein n=1 Tax=Kalanchoe fedtschenkoi TaxID=63787 RepID=A0A7N0RAD8_KALFE
MQTRYQTKYRRCDGKLVLKVTDNKECLKYKTNQAQDLKKLEKTRRYSFLQNVCITWNCKLCKCRSLIVLIFDLFEVNGTQQAESLPAKRGRGRKQ